MKISKKKTIIYHGIPKLTDYIKLVKSQSFKEIEKYSNSFINQTHELIDSYNKRWVPDPLHQWSRQWEYLYIIKQIKANNKQKQKILDLGAGITFLPYYLKTRNNVDDVVTLDYDKSLKYLYSKVNKILGEKIKFVDEDIRKLKLPNRDRFDCVYSVSVLEHTDNYDEIIKNCYRILNPNGKFILTFDISLDGNDDIPLKKARDLLGSIQKTFKPDIDLVEYLNYDSSRIVVSNKVAKIDKNLMPWKYPLINIFRPLFKTGHLGSPYKKLTFCCITVTKKP